MVLSCQGDHGNHILIQHALCARVVYQIRKLLFDLLGHESISLFTLHMLGVEALLESKRHRPELSEDPVHGVLASLSFLLSYAAATTLTALTAGTGGGGRGAQLLVLRGLHARHEGEQRLVQRRDAGLQTSV